MEVKEIIPNLNKRVRYKGSTSYTFTGGIVKKKENGEIYYLVALLDKNKNSLLIAGLEDVECLDL